MDRFVAGAAVASVMTAAGFLAGWSFAPRDARQTGSVESAPVANVDGAGDSTGSLQRLEAAVASLERAVLGRTAAASDRALAPQALPADSLSELTDKVDALHDRISELTLGLHEATRMRPEPDAEALAELRDESAADANVLRRRVIGLSYREATMAFGTPTKKRHGYGKIMDLPVTEWVWDMPEQGVGLIVSFAGGEARWAVFGRPPPEGW